MLRDTRYAFRSLLKRPGFAAIAVLCLALGMGVNSTVYSAVDAFFFRPLPFLDPGRLVWLTGVHPEIGTTRTSLSYQDLEAWRDNASAFERLAGYDGSTFTVSDGAGADRVPGAYVSWNLFSLIGAEPLVGRGFSPEDDRPGAEPVVLLGHALWERRFESDLDIVGKAVDIGDRQHLVIGIMPPAFEFPLDQEVWLPLAPSRASSTRNQRGVTIFGRLARGVDLDRARGDIGRTASAVSDLYGDAWSATADPMDDYFRPPEDAQLAIVAMMGAVTLVLLIACANVANLLLARATERHREIAVRAAVGAGRGRIVRQMLTESLLLAALSAPIGVLIATIWLRWMTGTIPAGMMPYYVDLTMNWRVVAYTGAAAVATGFLFGMAPALSASEAALNHSLREGGRGAGASIRRNGLRNGLVVGQVALSLVLLVGASLFVRSVLSVRGTDPGFDLDPLMTMRMSMAGDRYLAAEARTERVTDIVRRVEALPGVESAFASEFVPMSGGGIVGEVTSGTTRESPPEAAVLAVTSGARTTLGVPLVAGRDFRPEEGFERSGVALVTRDFAERVWPTETSVVGLQMRLPVTDTDEWLTVIGVVEDFLPWNVTDVPPIIALVPYPYRSAPSPGLTIRVAGMPPSSITPQVRRQVGEADPLLPLFDFRTARENHHLTFWDTEIIGEMFAVFGVIALVLAWIGIYGVLSYVVDQRTREFGIRAALGATDRVIVGGVLSHAAKLAAIGVAAGLVGAVGMTRLVRSLLYNVGGGDPVSFAAGGTVLVLAVLLASYLPARRATSVDPVVALREDG